MPKMQQDGMTSGTSRMVSDLANFSSGVSGYIRTRAVVEVNFPIDWRGSVEIACKHCNFYVNATRRCGLTQQVVNYPERYIGESCPLEEVTDDGSVEESTD